MKWIAVTSFTLLVATVFFANWLIERYGMVAVPFGLMAPAGVYAAGLAFGLRDILQDTGGRIWVVVAILVGAGCSFFVSPQFAVASAVAFLVSEIADFGVYTPLSDHAIHTSDHRLWITAVVLSNLIGAAVDSALFLWVAFGSLDFMAGQVVGKLLMTLPVLPCAWYARRRLQKKRESAMTEVSTIAA